jgi:hypothetical protein
MNAQTALKLRLLLLLLAAVVTATLPVSGQQTYLPGQFGLNSGILPSPGFTYTNKEITFILPKKNLALFFKHEHEYAAYARTFGNTLVFGGS